MEPYDLQIFADHMADSAMAALANHPRATITEAQAKSLRFAIVLVALVKLASLLEQED